MASPLTFYISPDCPLDIVLELDGGGADGSIESPTHRRTCRKYFVRNERESLHIRRSIEYDREYEGYLSPTHIVTLPKEVRNNGGVPLDAKYYAFLHPPIGLINDIDFKKYSAESPESLNSNYPSYLDIIALALNGGYVYFTNKYKVICVNAISIYGKGKKELKFSGPYEVNKDVCDEMQYLERPQGITYELFHEAGFVASAWVRPGETFRSKSITDKLHHSSGAFLFFRDDNSATAYILNAAGHRDRDGDLGTVIDVIQASRKNLCIPDFPKFTSPHKCTYSIKEWRDEIIYMDKTKTENEAKTTWSGSDKSNILKTIDDKRTLIHLACHAGLDLNLIKKLLSGESDSKFFNRLNLSYQDGRKWTPLHYACRFSPENIDLIKYLIKMCPQATIIADKYGRYPLHIACDSKCSTEVIISLLEQNSSEQVLKATKGLKRLPLHIACQRGTSYCWSAIASDGINEAASKAHVISETVADGSIQTDAEGTIKPACIISALLEKDEEGKTVRAETEIGRLPLHTAIQMKLHPETIKLLLYKDKEWKSDIYGQFNGMIPLHIACWNNSSTETIQLLLDKDEDGNTIDIMVDEDAWTSTEYCMVLKNFQANSSLDLKGSLSLKKTLGAAIHLAAEHGSHDVVLYLIKKERESQYQINRRNENGERYLKQPFLQDRNGKFPLHIACENNVNTSVIEMLLQEDPTKETFRTRDTNKRTPIHSLCSNKEAKKETLEILISAEKQYVEIEFAGPKKSVYKALDSEEPIPEHTFRRSAWSIDDRDRSPLYLAIKAGVSEDVLEVLLRPESFYLKGLDGAATNELAVRINNLSTVRSTLQDHVIDRLADRSFFFVLLIDFYTNVFALKYYVQGSENLLRGTITYFEPVIISICVGFFLLREVMQIRSQYGQYFVDLWSWQQLVCAGLLIMSLNHMFQVANEIRDDSFDESTIKRKLLILTGGMLILQFVFFLRSTFLPFARFVGGVLLISKTLIPFFIVSLLLLLAFAFSFRVNAWGERNCINMGDCIFLVLRGFFGGPGHPIKNGLDVVFSIVAFVVLLNVVIAIVDGAWTSAADHSTRLYWNFRLDFLSEVRYFFIIKQYISVDKLEKLATLIDNVETIKYINHVDWTKKPYNRILTRENYIKPFEWFTPDLASEITSAHSLQGDLYWIKREEDKREEDKREEDKREEDKCDQTLRWDRFKVITKWVMSCLLYLIIILLGILTAGLFWPKKFRKGVLSLGIEAAYTELEAVAEREAAELEGAVAAAASAKEIKEKND